MVTASEMGKRGGRSKSASKAEAARKNASKPRGKWVTAFHYGVIGADKKLHTGVVMIRGKFGLSLSDNEDQIMDEITEDINAHGPHSALPWECLDYFGGVQMRIV